MKTFLVVNPQSGNGATGKKWEALSRVLTTGIGPFGHAFTERPMHAADLARKALQEGHECIVVVGGDGTLNEVVNGFFLDGKPVSPSARLAVLPRGTGGDFRRTFGWDAELSSAIARVREGRDRPIDVGLLEYTTPEGAPAQRYFVNICSFGASGVVDREVNHGSKALGGKLSFMLGSVKALLKYEDQRVRLTLDGGAPKEMPVTTLAVANGRYFGGGMCVAPAADPSDGVFDITVWSGYTLADFALKSKAIYSGEHTKLKGTQTFRAKEVRAEPVVSGAEILLDVDGEQPGRLPCRMRVLPAAITLRG